MRAELRRAARELLRATPTACCACRGHLRRADQDEMKVVDALLSEGSWPAEVANHELVGAKLCVSCGHVTVLTYGSRNGVVAVWCPGFGLHVRVVASAN
jgi:hypothetical protein